MTKKLSIPEIIEAGYNMGFLAKIKIPNINGDRLIVQRTIQGVLTIDRSEKYSALYFENERLRIEGVEIIGWIYGGQLAGNGEIPKGQKFSSTPFGTGIFTGLSNNEFLQLETIDDARGPLYWVRSKYELQPVFN